MPLPPPDSASAGRASHPARVLLDSPLAAAARGRVYHRRAQSQPQDRRRRVLAMAGALLVHLFFLFGFVLGPAVEPTLTSPPEQALQVRLVEPPEPPAPPPVRGTPPKVPGPRHQGRRGAPAPRSEPSSNVDTDSAVRASPAPEPAVLARNSPSRAPAPKPLVAPPLPVSLPAPAPLPLPRPVLPAGEPPVLAVQVATPLPPTPPPFQPEPIRPAQAEGNRPILSPTSLALPKVSTPVPLDLPAMAMHVDVPKAVAAASLTPLPQSPVAPEVPRLQPLPLPAQSAAVVVLHASVSAPVAIVPKSLPPAQAPASEPGATALQEAPTIASPAPAPSASMPPERIDLDQPTHAPAVQPANLRPSVSTPSAVANVTTPASTAGTPGTATPAGTSAATEPATATRNDASTGAAEPGEDMSRAQDANPLGSDATTVGETAGVASAPWTSTSTRAATSPFATAASTSTGKQGKLQGAGKPGGDQPGAGHGVQHGAVGDYVQLKPSGDTEIMRHDAPNIGYEPTRFDKDWTPPDESSIDTALRHAVEKTTVKHVFHLPRGLRVECIVRPLLPSSLFGCHNPDPPAVRLPEKIYDRLNLSPAKPLAPPAPATSITVPPSASSAPMIRLDNSAECAAARVSGGPLPPRCNADASPPASIRTPAGSSSSWVPASDQFH
ncbi:MAG: hypothetical protein ABI386_08165 [Rhodanobacter sp.]